jgi:hypothetical protein
VKKMKRNRNNLERIEQRLRATPAVDLSSSFRRNVLEATAHLPAPAVIAPPRPSSGWRQMASMMTTGEKVTAGAILAALLCLLMPGAGAYLAALDYTLSTSVLSLSIGDTMLSASLLSIVAAAVCMVFLILGSSFAGRRGGLAGA